MEFFFKEDKIKISTTEIIKIILKNEFNLFKRKEIKIQNNSQDYSFEAGEFSEAFYDEYDLKNLNFCSYDEILQNLKLKSNAKIKGIEIHQQFYKEIENIIDIFNPNYNNDDVRFEYSFIVKIKNFEINSKIDIINFLNNVFIEIKTGENILKKLNYNSKNKLFNKYFLQLDLYAYLLKKKFKKDFNGFLLLYDLEKNEFEILNKKLNYRSFGIKFSKVLKVLNNYYSIRKNITKKIIKKNLKFSYKNPRPIQNKIINFLNEEDNTNKFFFIEAPFGSGKTAAVLYGIIKSFKDKYGISDFSILYLTSRNIQKFNVFAEATKLNFSSLIINSIKSYCLYDYELCLFDNCRHNNLIKDNFLKLIKYFTEENLKVEQIKDEKNLIKNFKSSFDHIFNYYFTKINNTFSKYNLCGYPLVKQFKDFFNLLIADHNYLFYYHDNLSLFNRINFLVIDEIHTFYKRFKQRFTIEISRFHLEEFYKILYNNFTGFDRSRIESIKEFFYKNFFSDYFDINYKSSLNNIEEFEILNDFVNYAEIFYRKQEDFNRALFIKLLYDYIDKFKRILLLKKAEGEVFNKNNSKLIFTVSSFSKLFNTFTNRFYKVYGISATLRPESMIEELSNNQYNIFRIIEKRNIKVYIKSDVETIYKKRKYYVVKIADFIKDRVKAGKNYLILAASRDYLKEIEVFIFGNSINKIFIKREDIDNIDDLYSKITHFLNKEKANLIFIPYNSIFSEGIELKFKLDEIFCIGLPFAKPDLSYYAQADLLLEKDQDPFKILSLFPAINEVLQATGRIGRTYSGNNHKIYLIGKDFLSTEVFQYIQDLYNEIEIL